MDNTEISLNESDSHYIPCPMAVSMHHLPAPGTVENSRCTAMMLEAIPDHALLAS
ncbi:MAG: hypothetical protein KKC01_04570 [Gammaproteobacteria bacterium]|nr:hypothetical protein [Gammaproteobacteria bacterium]